MDFKGKRVLVTGGTGFIGSHLVRKLQELGAELLLLVHKTPHKGDYALQVFGDLTDLNGWKTIIEQFRPEIVFHLAAQPLVSVASKDGLNTLDVNVKGTYNLLDVCRGIKSINSFVHISTDKVYGNISPITDDACMNAGVHHPYNASKLASDCLAQMYSTFYNLPMVIVRNANVYGAGDIHFDRIVPRTIQRIFKGEHPVIRGDGSNTRDYIHVIDVVDGYINAASLPYKNKFVTLNLCGMNYSVLDVVDCITSKMSRIDLSPVYEPMWKGEIPHQHIENDRAFRLINWLPMTDLDKGLDLTIPWYVEYLKNGK